VPRDLPKYKRDDLIPEIVHGILEGNIAEADVGKAAKGIIADYNRKFGDFQRRSLDDVLPGTTIRRVDMLVAPKD
jgi:hypothetical protein